MTNIRHIDIVNSVKFITFVCRHNFKLLEDKFNISILTNSINEIKKKYNFHLLGYVIMPNHVHLVLYVLESISIGKIIGEIKARAGYRIIEKWKKIKHPDLSLLRINRDGQLGYAFWQKRCYEHTCRNQESVKEKINYCHLNPVKAGLVSDPRYWPYSSHNYYQGFEDSLLKIDSLDMM